MYVMKRIITLLYTVLAMIATVRAQTDILERGLEGRCTDADPIARKYVVPARLVALPDSLVSGVDNAEALLRPFDGQLVAGPSDVCRLSAEQGRSASLLLDFGKELYGGLELAAAIRPDLRALKVRIRYGESVSEAMSEVDGTTPMSSATNQHSLRDFTLDLPWLGSVEVGNSGCRFVRIDLVEPEAVLDLRSARAVLKYRDIPYRGSFRCSDDRLTRIWETGAYTVHLCMQNYLWDGIKRDRLVWLGDMHPEMMTVMSVFGDNEVVRKSLDFGRDTTPLPGWMNGIAAYSMWWVLIHRDLYLYTGDRDYLSRQREYMLELFRLLAAGMNGDREQLSGFRLLDWPTSEMPEAIHAGYQALMIRTMEAGHEIGEWLEDEAMIRECGATLERLHRHIPDHGGNKQAAALLTLAGLCDAEQTAREVVAKGGAEGFSTFYGYYMLEAPAQGGCYDDFYNRFWRKALRTLYVNMRDNYFDCPDRERAQWWGDVVVLMGESFYTYSTSTHALMRKAIRELAAWQKPDGALFSPIPAGNYSSELPGQMLASVGLYGFWNYYMNTGDRETIRAVYPAVRRYLSLWTTDETGFTEFRKGGWTWGDWGENRDVRLIFAGWHSQALEGAARMASLLELPEEAAAYREQMARVKEGYLRCWNGEAFRHPDYREQTDDRVQALAVLAGIADESHYEAIGRTLCAQRHASPYMEKYVMEALFSMGRGREAMKRTAERFADMVDDPDCTTLFVGWGVGEKGFGGGTTNHAWSGGALTVIAGELCGIRPLEAGYAVAGIEPDPASLRDVEIRVPTVRGVVEQRMTVRDEQLTLDVTIPRGVTAVVTLPGWACGMTLDGRTPSSACRRIDAKYRREDRLQLQFGGGTYRIEAGIDPASVFASELRASR